MKTWKSIKSEQRQVGELKGLVEVYEELSASKMQQIRVKIVVARDYYEGLRELLVEVGGDVGVSDTSAGPEAVVWIAANNNLFGKIIEETRTLFIQELTKNPRADAWIVGRTGVSQMQQFLPERESFTLDLPDESLQEEGLLDLVSKLGDYKRIKVIYGSFENIVRQVPMMRDVVGMRWSQWQTSSKEAINKRKKYLYEPSYTQVAEVFGHEIMSGVMHQMVVESELAKYASRIMHLDQAMEKIEDNMVSLKRAERKVHGRRMEQKQQSMIGNMMLRGATW